VAKALVVDDSRTLRIMMGRLLKEAGYELGEAGDGQAAWTLLDAAPGEYEVALVDWNMPVMTGIELVRKVRADRRFDALVIVMVTTETEMTQMSSALEAGANEYVTKPFTRDMLLDKLRMVTAQ
jgi:two-component system, chemotaxis family, chemotaxis protein CheY